MAAGKTRIPVPGRAEWWFRAARVAKVHGTCSPIDRRVLYSTGRWASNGWEITPRMYRRALMALGKTLGDVDAAREWIEGLGADAGRTLVEELRRATAQAEAVRGSEPTLPCYRHAVCGRCGNGWPFAAGENCPQCGAVAARLWWFEVDGQVTEVRYVRKHKWFQS
ncbi:MAG: hypothetical protein RDU89_04405 [bacterium]|nr:hypothetical protein [bacterium]